MRSVEREKSRERGEEAKGGRRGKGKEEKAMKGRGLEGTGGEKKEGKGVKGTPVCIFNFF